MANITGTSGSDFLNGTVGDDHIVGLGASDQLNGLEGSDWLEGGGGDDTLNDGGGDDLAEGGDGNDYFRNEDGNDTLNGGAGDDLFDVLRGSGHSNLVTMTGGIGRDRFLIRSIGTTNFVLDAGDGDDHIRIDTYKGDHFLTLGVGIDTVSVAGPLFFSEFLTTTITDFTAGAGGDRLDFNEFFLANASSWDGDQSPFASGFLRLVQSGADVVVEIDQDGGGNSYVEYIRLANVSAAALTYHNLDGFPADGSIPAGLTFAGTSGRDTFVGAAGGDSISGLEDNDFLYGGAGNDTIRGGDGWDELHGEGGNDLIEGGRGSDRLEDGYGDDIVRGGDDGDIIISDTRGNDLLEGEGGDDHIDVRRGLNYQVTVNGGDGNDYLVITAYNIANLFTVNGGAGNDIINSFSMAGTARVSLGGGSDEISLAWSGFSTLYSGHFIISDFDTGAGGDRIDFDQWLSTVTNWDQASNPFQTGQLRLVQSGADTLLQVDANGGGDNLRTMMTFSNRNVAAFTPYNLDGFAADGSAPPGVTLIGTTVGETLTGGAGDDRIEGRGGFDSLSGMGGADLIIGGDQGDSILGGSGDDRIESGGGQDIIDAGTGDDLVYAGDGNDQITINNGADTVWAGAGNDTIAVQTSPPEGGTILVQGEGGSDTIRLLGSNSGTFIVADGGADADIIEVGDLAGTATLTLGSGSDRVMVYGNAGAGSYSPGDVRITDFAAGAGGDLIDLAGSLGLVLLNWDGSNPFNTGHARLVQKGSDTLLRIDRDGSGPSHGFVTVFTLSNVGAGSLTTANLGFDPHLIVGPGGYSNLQAAIDAAQDGDTIVIAAGTYVGDANVNKAVTILGPNQGVAGTASRAAEAVIDGMLTISAAGTTVDGVKFIGRGVSPLGGHDAVVVLANDFTLTNSVFDAQLGANGAVHTPYYSVTGLEISRSLIEGYNNGILIGGANTSGSVHHNRFQGDGTTSGIGNGISSWSSRLVIADNVFDKIYSASIGLNPNGPATVDIQSYVTGNTITNSGVAQPVLIIPTEGSRNFTGTDFADWFAGETGQASYAAAGMAFSFDGRGGNDLAEGGDRSDSLAGGPGDDELSGKAGDDRLDGGSGSDTMRGGIGNDSYIVDSAGDTVDENSGEGTDEVRTGLATYVLAANVENLTATSGVNHDFRGNSGNNFVTGAGGNDFFRLQDGGDDRALGGDGNDVFLFGSTMDGLDAVNGGAGTDQIALQGGGAFTFGSGVVGFESLGLLSGADTRFGDPGGNLYSYNLTTRDINVASGVELVVDGAKLLAGENLTFNGSAETDGSFFIYGGRGIDTLTGGARNDVFLFGSDNHFGAGDVVNGGSAGIDQLALRGNYTLTFGASQLVGIESLGLLSAFDTRFGALGTTYSYNLTTHDGNVAAGVQMTVDGAKLRGVETLVFNGAAETDGSFRIFGGINGDTLAGGQSGDILQGHGGADTFTGGGGADQFRYASASDSTAASRDHILDFTSGTDKIDLSRIDANGNVAGDQAFSWIGANAFSGAAGQLRDFQQGGEWIVQGDVNGDGVADLVIALTLQGPTPLSAGDFFL